MRFFNRALIFARLCTRCSVTASCVRCATPSCFGVSPYRHCRRRRSGARPGIRPACLSQCRYGPSCDVRHRPPPRTSILSIWIGSSTTCGRCSAPCGDAPQDVQKRSDLNPPELRRERLLANIGSIADTDHPPLTLATTRVPAARHSAPPPAARMPSAILRRAGRTGRQDRSSRCLPRSGHGSG